LSYRNHASLYTVEEVLKQRRRKVLAADLRHRLTLYAVETARYALPDA
jgi:hypothetical protein